MDKVQLFTEPVPRSNNYVPVEALDPELEHIRVSIEEKYKLIQEINTEFKTLLQNCKHQVWFDEDVYPYTHRTCAICKKIIERI